MVKFNPKVRKIIRIITILLITGVAALGVAVSLAVGFYIVRNTILEYRGIDSLEVIALINRNRIENGLAPLSYMENLCPLASSRLSRIKYDFTHKGFRDISQQYMAENSIYHLGENIARGMTTHNQVVDMWMESPTHKANILAPRFTHTCVKCDSKYCVQIFAEPSPTNP